MTAKQDLHKRALAALREQHKQDVVDGRTAQELIEELQVNQVDLEQRNEELVVAQSCREETLNRYDSPFHDAPVGYMEIDATGHIVEINRTLARWLHGDTGDMVGRDVSSLVEKHAKDQDAWLLHWHKLKQGDATADCVLRVRRRDSSSFPVAVESTAQKASGAFRGCRSALTDLSARRAAEREQDALERRFRSTFENAAVGIAHVAPDGSYLRVNRRLCEMTGYSHDELGQRTFMDITHPDDLDADLDRAAALRAGAIDSYSMEKRYRHKDGSVVWIDLTGSASRDADGNVEYFIAIIQDISARKEAEARILNLSHFPEQNPYPVMRVSDTGRLLYANAGSRFLLEHWKVTQGQTLPEHLQDTIAQSVASGRMANVEFRVEDRCYAMAFVPIPEAGYLNIYGRDVTDARLAERRERDAAIKMTAANTAVDTVNAMGEGVALCDTDGTIRSVNPAFEALTAYDSADMIGKDVQSLFPAIFSEPPEQVRETIARVQLKASKQDPDNALTITTKDQARKSVIPTLTVIHGPRGEAVGMVLTLRDITPLVQAQQRVREREQQYRELVENANSIIMRMTPDHRISFFNEYAQTFFGYTADEIVGKDLVGTILPEVDEQGRNMRTIIAKIAAHPETHGFDDKKIIRKDGSRAWVHWSNRAIRDERGEVKEILCVGTDITERKRLERQADIYRARLRALADRLSSSEAHERRRVATQLHDTVIQTLSLSSIRLGGIMEALAKAGMVDERNRLEGVRQLLDQGSAECRGLMNELVPSLLYEVGLVPALKAFVESRLEQDRTRVVIEELPESQTMDDAVRGPLFQCGRELITNALKYAGRCEIRVLLSHSEQYHQLQIADTGRGFDPIKLKGETYDTDGGFGLFNIRERLETLGGRLEIQSAPGTGTTATAYVPRSNQP